MAVWLLVATHGWWWPTATLRGKQGHGAGGRETSGPAGPAHLQQMGWVPEAAPAPPFRGCGTWRALWPVDEDCCTPGDYGFVSHSSPGPAKQGTLRRFTRSPRVTDPRLADWMQNVTPLIFHSLCSYRLQTLTAMCSAAIKNDKALQGLKRLTTGQAAICICSACSRLIAHHHQASATAGLSPSHSSPRLTASRLCSTTSNITALFYNTTALFCSWGLAQQVLKEKPSQPGARGDSH